MNINTTIIALLSFILGAALLLRVAYQLNKRKSYSNRFDRIPSSAAAPTLTLDLAVGVFLIAVAAVFF